MASIFNRLRVINVSKIRVAALAGAGVITATTMLSLQQRSECEPSYISSAVDSMPTKPPFHIVLYQYEPCPYCNKVRAFLDFQRLPYTVVEVNPLSKAELKFSPHYKKVPVCTVDSVQINDSTEIISQLRQKSPGALTGHTAEQTAREDKYRTWVDEKFIHLLPPNIYRTPTEALQAFDYLLTHGNFGAMERRLAKYVGAVSMYLLCEFKLKKKHGIVRPREELYAAVEGFIGDLKGPFLNGATPDLGDLAVFGAMRSLKGYPTFDDVMANTSASTWYGEMEKAVGPSCRISN